jgi:hypothetical protein
MSGRRALRSCNNSPCWLGIGELVRLGRRLAWGAECMFAERFHLYRTTTASSSLIMQREHAGLSR